jgi:hypothetical protein
MQVHSFPGKIFFKQRLVRMPNHIFNYCTHFTKNPLFQVGDISTKCEAPSTHRAFGISLFYNEHPPQDEENSAWFPVGVYLIRWDNIHLAPLQNLLSY